MNLFPMSLWHILHMQHLELPLFICAEIYPFCLQIMQAIRKPDTSLESDGCRRSKNSDVLQAISKIRRNYATKNGIGTKSQIMYMYMCVCIVSFHSMGQYSVSRVHVHESISY